MSGLGNKQAFITDPQTGDRQIVIPGGLNPVVEIFRLIGDNFDPGVLLPHIWTIQELNGGTASTISSPGQLIMSTNTTANGRVTVQSTRRARFIIGSLNLLKQSVATPNLTAIDTIRRWGCFDPENIVGNGAFFQLQDGNYSVIIRDTGVDTLITEANFNGGNVLTKDVNAHFYNIFFSRGLIEFFQDFNLIHKTLLGNTLGFSDPHCRIGQEIENINGKAINEQLIVRGGTIDRVGSSAVRPIPFHINSAQSLVIKPSPGNLHNVIVNRLGTGNASLEIFESGTPGSGSLIATIDLANGVVDHAYNMEFEALSFVSTGGQIDVTVTYD